MFKVGDWIYHKCGEVGRLVYIGMDTYRGLFLDDMGIYRIIPSNFELSNAVQRKLCIK